MRKKLFLICFFLLVFLLVPKRVLATNGQDCRNAGGVCRAYCFTDQSETNIGNLDCPSYNIDGIPQQEICCKVGTGCLGDNLPCEDSSKCCSENCEYDSHQRQKICKPIIGPSPTEGPGPGIKFDPTCNEGTGINTALGCIPVGEFSDFVAWLLRRLIGIAGGIAFLLVIFGGFKILTSAGNPKGIQAGNEMITSALIGLLFIIFSVFLLELIGVKILSIPGL